MVVHVNLQYGNGIAHKYVFDTLFIGSWLVQYFQILFG
ncbi:unnamed protein product [Brassica oleracea var. botrytis]|uniref:Uncharacterized protein n=2 Tax=Brassica TaxID=3705 RepID=A0A3P6EZ81_BRAOL|nr:unnamed protein product [Brassica napus]VDD40204.1 unnamed protein product [Brassica oleracea]